MLLVTKVLYKQHQNLFSNPNPVAKWMPTGLIQSTVQGQLLKKKDNTFSKPWDNENFNFQKLKVDGGTKSTVFKVRME